MKKVCFVLFVLLFGYCFSQSLEEQIYTATESFTATSNPGNLAILNSDISKFEPQIKSKDEYFAFINLVVNKGYYLAENNTPQEAISAYEKAYQIYTNQKITSYDIIEYCLIPLGILYTKTNAYIKAENITKHYILQAQKQQNKSQEVTGSINLAKLYQSLNKHESVITIIDKTLKIENIKPQQKELLNAIKNRSLVLLNNQIIGSYDLMSLNNKDQKDFELYYEIALKNKDYITAYTYFERIKNSKLNRSVISKRESAKLSFEEAQLLYLIDKPEASLVELKNTLALLLPNYNASQRVNTQDLYTENTFIDAFDLLAELQPNPLEKLYAYDLSFYVATLLQNEISDEQSTIVNAGSQKNRSEKCIAILYDLYQNKKDSTYIERAINYAELHKASALKNNANRKKLLQKHPDNSLLLKEDALLKKQNHLTSKLLNQPLNQKNIQQQDSLRLSLIEIGIELKTLRDSIDKTFRIKNDNRLQLNNIRSKLKSDNATLVEYFYGKNNIYQFIFSETNVAFNKIIIQESTTKTIANFIDYFNDASVINSKIPAFTEDAFLLYKLLNFDAVIDHNKVVIIPDGLLNFIPFEALLTEKTASTLFSKMPFLVKTQSVAYNSNIVFYLDASSQRSEDKLLGVFPVFENSNQELAFTVDEAKNIDKHISSNLLMREEATKDAFLSKVNNYSVLHLSTHASAGSFTEPAEISFFDSNLTLDELYNLNIESNLVVLSACETGVGKLQKAEGAMSITRGFQYAGADNILFSLWQINDLSTSQIMSSFYNYYGKGQSALFSNRQSKIDYLNTTKISNAKQSPYYWSAFMYYGELSATNTSKSTLLFWCIALLSMLIIVFLIFKIKRKNAKHA